MRLIVTGGSGFVGRQALAVAVQGGHEVIAIGRSDPGVVGVAFVPCDLMQPQDIAHAMGGVCASGETLLHCAWYAEPPAFWNASQNLDWVARSIDLARAFANAGGQRLVVAGSCAEYDWSPAVAAPPLDEMMTPLRPATLYGRAKVALHDVLAAAAPTLGLSLGWGRIFFPYGPGDRPERLVGSLIAALREGRAADFSEGLQRRDFIHVADVGAALAALATSQVEGAVNIGSGQATAVRDMVLTAARIAGREDLVRLGARPGGLDEVPCIEAATRRLREEVGFTPRFDIAAGLRDTLAAAGLT